MNSQYRLHLKQAGERIHLKKERVHILKPSEVNWNIIEEFAIRGVETDKLGQVSNLRRDAAGVLPGAILGRDLAGEKVSAEVEMMEEGHGSDGEEEGTGHVVVVEVKDLEIGEAGEVGGEGGVEGVVGEVEMAEGGECGKGGRDWVRELVVDEGENDGSGRKYQSPPKRSSGEIPPLKAVHSLLLSSPYLQEKHSTPSPQNPMYQEMFFSKHAAPSNQQVATGLPNSSWTKPMLLVFAAGRVAFFSMFKKNPTRGVIFADCRFCQTGHRESPSIHCQFSRATAGTIAGRHSSPSSSIPHGRDHLHARPEALPARWDDDGKYGGSSE
ncbi:hypothetical protein LR48_Vigan853s000200 [Vigna angularis]|uniref:Uncharacterized protein n=1 Tax=Phaseolus angularis TaxID=3914 RepID=A0A0L9TIW2_PHAAN|nr:hypothetical protein LR48_Vigan853s000200 [Vigna angularis]